MREPSTLDAEEMELHEVPGPDAPVESRVPLVMLAELADKSHVLARRISARYLLHRRTTKQEIREALALFLVPEIRGRARQVGSPRVREHWGSEPASVVWIDIWLDHDAFQYVDPTKLAVQALWIDHEKVLAKDRPDPLNGQERVRWYELGGEIEILWHPVTEGWPIADDIDPPG